MQQRRERGNPSTPHGQQLSNAELEKAAEGRTSFVSLLMDSWLMQMTMYLINLHAFKNEIDIDRLGISLHYEISALDALQNPVHNQAL